MCISQVVDISLSNLDSSLSSPAFCMMHSAYKLHKEGDNTALTYSFPNFEPVCYSMSSSLASCPAYRFLRRQVMWSDIPISLRILQFVVIHTVKGFSIVSETEVDISLKFPCFFYDPTDDGNLISGSSAFSKSKLHIWKFFVHVLLKLSLKDFEHYLASM